MTLTNAIKKAEKIAGQKVSVNGQFYLVSYKGKGLLAVVGLTAPQLNRNTIV